MSWAYCWDSPWVSKCGPSPRPPPSPTRLTPCNLCRKANGSVLNATSVAEYFEGMASPAQPGSGIAAKGLDECLPSNEAVKGEADAAAVGFRKARRKHPNAYIAAWGSQAGDMRFASLMADGTFSLAMVEALEGYSCKTAAYSPPAYAAFRTLLMSVIAFRLPGLRGLASRRLLQPRASHHPDRRRPGQLDCGLPAAARLRPQDGV
eukprot:SAG11_NODE_389_length_9870_cov_7.646812_7_plen_206_part_00